MKFRSLVHAAEPPVSDEASLDDAPLGARERVRPLQSRARRRLRIVRLPVVDCGRDAGSAEGNTGRGGLSRAGSLRLELWTRRGRPVSSERRGDG